LCTDRELDGCRRGRRAAGRAGRAREVVDGHRGGAGGGPAGGGLVGVLKGIRAALRTALWPNDIIRSSSQCQHGKAVQCRCAAC